MAANWEALTHTLCIADATQQQPLWGLQSW